MYVYMYLVGADVCEVGLQLLVLDQARLPRAHERREAARGRGEVKSGRHDVGDTWIRCG